MFKTKHNRNAFYKYYSPSGAISTLESGSFKWSAPSLFNDPFDCQFPVSFKGNSEEIHRILIDRLIEDASLLENRHICYRAQDVQILFYLIKMIFMSGKPQSQIQETLNNIRNIEADQGMRKRFDDVIAGLDHRRQSESKEARIFCVAETNDNLLMWSHYAQNHSGIVIKIRCIPKGKGSPLCAGVKVKYQDSIPNITADSVVKMLMCLDDLEFNSWLEDLYDSWFFTKSTCWSYEKEWRVFGFSKSLKYQGFDLYKFSPEEIGAVYLGCRMEEKLKFQILDLVAHKYPRCNIFQSKIREKEYGLDFMPIPLLGT